MICTDLSNVIMVAIVGKYCMFTKGSYHVTLIKMA